MCRAVCWFAIALGTVASLSVRAETPRVISFDDAVSIALERNTDLLSAQVDAALGDLSVREARMQFLPDLRFDAQGGRNYGRSFYEAEGRALDQTTESATIALSSGLVLFNGFRDLSTLRRAKFAQRASFLDLRYAEQTAVFTVASRFLFLVQSREQLRVSRENLTAEANLERQINDFVTAGSREVAVLYQQEANVAAARLTVAQAENVVQSDEVELLRTLQLDPAGTYEFQFPSAPADDMPQPPDRADLLERAVAQRFDLKAEEARLQMAEQDVGIARSAFWPTLSLNTRYGSEYSSVPEASFRDQLESARGGVVGLSVSMPILDRGEASNSLRRARLETLRARIALDAAREEVRLQVRQVHQDYQAAREQLFAAQAQGQAAERAMETAEERFKAGVTTLLEVTQARARQVQAARALVDTRSNLQLQRIRMDYYLGKFSQASFTSE